MVDEFKCETQSVAQTSKNLETVDSLEVDLYLFQSLFPLITLKICCLYTCTYIKSK